MSPLLAFLFGIWVGVAFGVLVVAVLTSGSANDALYDSSLQEDPRDR